MSRIINPDSAGKERTHLVRSVALAVRHLALQQDIDAETHDLVAFITLALEGIADTIEVSVSPWEKRDYWVKADRFRQEWAWTGTLGKKMRLATINEDWGEIASISIQVAQKLGKIKIPAGHRIGTPWVGAWDEFKKMN